MFRSRHSPDPARLKFLACLAVLGLLACFWLGFRMRAGSLARSPLTVLALVVIAAALLTVLLRLLGRISARRNQPDLSASELSTLTFPPEPRVQRPQLQRAK
jgi:hypothetical protein